ncbi:MAG: hypothetical protein J7K72_01125 [Candidatus Aenigmarchaeota archaeon]|nr:hypothetical protein [Candidatus Aenigmarchaeota archaeon]
MRTKILYKSFPADRKPHGFQYKKGVWYKTKGELKMCENGFHASENIIDAMNYITPGYVGKVQVRGKSIVEKDKQCWEKIRVIEWHKWTGKDSIALAVFAAELVLPIFEKEYPNDKRPRKAIETAKEVLERSTPKNMTITDVANAATDAVAYTAYTVANATAYAANAAANAAVYAANAAANAAAYAANVAANAATDAVAYAANAATDAVAYAANAMDAGSTATKGTLILKECHNFVLKRKFKKKD